MKEFKAQTFTGERALFSAKDLKLTDCIFDAGESPLKESANVLLERSFFKWKYPLWYASNVTAENCTWYEMGRAGVWYSKNVTVKNAVIEAPKNFRRCENLTLCDVLFSNAAETLWSCSGVKAQRVTAVKGDYFAMNTDNVEMDQLDLVGNYAFDGSKNVTIRNSRMLTKDAFWNSENVTVYDSFISGEYLGWNSKNLTLINCTIESLQGMCYIENLKLIDCRLVDTTLAFEYSSVEAKIDSEIKSVFNPSSGLIKAESIGELILEKDEIDPSKTVIVCSKIAKKSDKPEWKK